MYARLCTPSIEITIGRETRLYHAFITTAPTTIDAPATVTLHTASLAAVSGMAADDIALDPERANLSARLVLVDATELSWQRVRYREGKHLFTPADPVLVGLDTLQHWLWHRIESPPGIPYSRKPRSGEQRAWLPWPGPFLGGRS